MLTVLSSLVISAALATPPDAPPRGGPPGPPPIGVLVMHLVEEIDLPDGERQAVRDLGDQARAELEAAHEAVIAAHGALADALTMDAPQRSEVLAAARTLEAAEARLRERELLLVVDVAEILGPEAWAQVADQLPPPGGPPPERGARAGR